MFFLAFQKKTLNILFSLLLPVSTTPSLKCLSKQLPANSNTTVVAPAELSPCPPPPLVSSPPPPSPPAPPPHVAPPAVPCQPEVAVVQSEAPREEKSKEEEVREEVSFITSCQLTVLFLPCPKVNKPYIVTTSTRCFIHKHDNIK